MSRQGGSLFHLAWRVTGRTDGRTDGRASGYEGWRRGRAQTESPTFFNARPDRLSITIGSSDGIPALTSQKKLNSELTALGTSSPSASIRGLAMMLRDGGTITD